MIPRQAVQRNHCALPDTDTFIASASLRYQGVLRIYGSSWEYRCRVAHCESDSISWLIYCLRLRGFVIGSWKSTCFSFALFETNIRQLPRVCPSINEGSKGTSHWKDIPHWFYLYFFAKKKNNGVGISFDNLILSALNWQRVWRNSCKIPTVISL